MITLEKAIREYLSLSRPQFVSNNPFVPTIMAAAATSLVSKMWVDGTDLIPGTWFVALTGRPRSGKSAFYRSYFKMFPDRIAEIPIGSPESMLKNIASIKHGYIYYDEVAHLAKLMNSYMGTLPTILNRAYYLDTLSQTRMDGSKSAVVHAGEYFAHVYFAGTQEDWLSIERQAPGGFVRRTLVIPVKGTIPFFKKSHKDRLVLEQIGRLRAWIKHIYSMLLPVGIIVYLPEFNELGEALTKTRMDDEKKSMVEEYFYKLFAGRIVNNLITFDTTEDKNLVDTSEIVNRMLKNAEAMGVRVETTQNDPAKVVLEITVPELDDLIDPQAPEVPLDRFMPPHHTLLTFNQLINTVKFVAGAPDDITMRNVERIRAWLEAGGPPVISKRKFAQEILHTKSPQFYNSVMEILQDAGYIRIVESMYRGRQVKYIVLDPRARVCANCANYLNPMKCPQIFGKRPEDFYKITPPGNKACDKFELVGEENEGKS